MVWTWPRASRLDGASMRASKTTQTASAQSPEAKATTTFAPFAAIHNSNDAVWTQPHYASVAREGYMRNPIVHSAIRLIAQSAASVPWLLYDDVTEHSDHPLLRLLKRPNSTTAGVAFMERLYGHLLLAGNVYLERVDGNYSHHELHLLTPDRVKIETDDTGWMHAFSYSSGRQKRFVEVHTPNSPGLHIALFHPLDDHQGLSPLNAALMAIDSHNAAGNWNKALLDNSARPSGALVYAPNEGGNLSDDQYQRLKTELEEGYSGVKRAGRPLLLEGGLDWKTMGMSPKDMDFIEARNCASREIALTLGVPPMLLGIPGDNTYSNYREAKNAFYQMTIAPLLTRVATDFSHWLAPNFGENLRLELDKDAVEGMSGSRDSLWERVANADFLTEDEKREAVGYQPLGRGVSRNV